MSNSGETKGADEGNEQDVVIDQPDGGSGDGTDDVENELGASANEDLPGDPAAPATSGEATEVSDGEGSTAGSDGSTGDASTGDGDAEGQDAHVVEEGENGTGQGHEPGRGYS